MSPLVFGLFVAVVGMVIVFIGLALLIFCVTVMGRFMSRKKKEESSPELAAEPIAETTVAEGVSGDELVAVISAAVAAFSGSGGGSFVVRSVRRAGGNVPAWAAAGRVENLSGR